MFHFELFVAVQTDNVYQKEYTVAWITSSWRLREFLFWEPLEGVLCFWGVWSICIMWKWLLTFNLKAQSPQKSLN